MTPRQAVKTEKGRGQVVKWLDGVETWTREQPETADYDFGWIWEELGITELRKKK